MSKFNHYAKDLDSKAKEHFSIILAADRELKEAEAERGLYPSVVPQFETLEQNQKRLAAELRLSKAKDNKAKANENARKDLDSFYKAERVKLSKELDDYYALNPSDLQPEIMEMLKSGAANSKDFKRLFELAEADNNITMIRMIGAAAEEKGKDETNREYQVIYNSIAHKAKEYTGAVQLANYEAHKDVIDRCINNHGLIDFYNNQFSDEMTRDF